MQAGGAESDESRRKALASFSEAYWPPLYTFVRRRGYSPADAQDIVQAFFVQLLEQNTLSRADRERGRLRTFLLTSLENFLRKKWAIFSNGRVAGLSRLREKSCVPMNFQRQPRGEPDVPISGVTVQSASSVSFSLKQPKPDQWDIRATNHGGGLECPLEHLSQTAPVISIRAWDKVS